MNSRTKKNFPWLVVLLFMGGWVLGAGLPGPGGDGEVGNASSSDVAMLILYVALALIFSFLCSIAEAVLLSITPSYIASLEDTKPALAGRLKKLKQENIDRSLAAILTLNTIAHTVGAIGSGAKATVVFGSQFFGIFSAVMTLLILFLSEIIPKTLGAVHWRALAGPTARFVGALNFLLYPLILVSEKLTRMIAKGENVHAFSRDEFTAMATIGEESGQIAERESRIIHNLFRLSSITSSDIMTPRTVITAFPEEVKISQALETPNASSFSRFPIFRENLDQITGLVLKNDLLLHQAKGEGDKPVKDARRDIVAVPESMPLTDLLELFLESRSHMVVVVNEYGGTQGLATLEDAVETLLGMEIIDEMDQITDMRELARRQWKKRAKALGIQPLSTPEESGPDPD